MAELFKRQLGSFGAELHPLDYWVLDMGAAWTMKPRKELLDDVRAVSINEVCSASGHARKVAGAGGAAFKGADGKPVVLHDVLLVPYLRANLISLCKLTKAGVSSSTNGARTYKWQLGNRMLWDLHESKEVYRSMWQLPALAWHGGGQAGEESASQGECNAIGGVGVNLLARSGETDWATAYPRFGHLDLTPSVWKEGEEAAAEGGDKEKVQEAPAGGGDDVETSGSTKEAAGSEGGEQQLGIAKSRLVAKGFMQKEKQDFNEIFAPTAKPSTLRVLLADVAVSGKFIIQMDISTAFLNGILEEDEYMTQPPGYEDGTGRVCKLKKSIYGLKQAPRCWYQKLAAVLEEMGFWTSSCDESLFLKGEGEKLVLFLVYVDDILLFSSSMKEIQNVQQQLMKNFKCKTLGEVKYYLGMHVERDLVVEAAPGEAHQGAGEKYGIENERKVATPLPAEFKLVKAAEDEGVEVEEQQQFQSLVGSLLYAAVHTRPDISFSVGQLARVVQNPSEEQVDAAERVQKGVEVLKEKEERLGEGKLFLTCFIDATWASEKDDSSSVGGYICVVGGGPVSWRSKKQTETALSSVESEYMAMFHGVKEVIWLRRLLEEIGQEQKVATPLFCDSKGALGMARNAVLHGLNKHMRIKWHWLRKEVKRGTVNPIYIKTHQQPADFLTKRLADEPHWRCVRMSGMSMN
ncbi:unnamed protein product [Closterium sp. NIES-53]